MAKPAPALHKAIGYAYPTSPAAAKLGCSDAGCWFVSTGRVDGRGKAKILSAGYDRPDHPDLVAAYHAAPGTIEPCFHSHGHAGALAAIGVERAR